MKERAAIGKAELTAQLDARFRAPLMSFFLRRVGVRAEAEDLTQDVFARLLAMAAREEVEDPEALVFRIAANLLKDRGRRHSVRASAHLQDVDPHLVDEVAGEFVELCTPERALMSKMEVAGALDALDELGERTRDIYILFRLEAMKQKEIAALFGLTVKSVEKHVLRATLHLTMRRGR